MNNPFDDIYRSMIAVDTKRCFEEPLEFPKELHIELTNKCNLKCPFCPTGTRTCKREKGFMREDLYWAIVTEALQYKAALRFVRWGEPTLHIRCFDYIRWANKVGIKTHLNTNGINLDIGQVLDSGLDSIKFSLHNLDAIPSIKALIEARESAGLDKPYVTIAELSSETHQRARGGGREYADSLKADRFVYAPVKPLNRGGRCPKQCWELYNRLSINWDGSVVACCGSYDNQMKVGHIYDRDTLKEIWDGSGMNRYRSMEQNGTLWQVPLCDKCAR